jgi:hypothetical protein
MHDHHQALNPKYAHTTWVFIPLSSRHHINFFSARSKINFSEILKGHAVLETQT